MKTQQNILFHRQIKHIAESDMISSHMAVRTKFGRNIVTAYNNKILYILIFYLKLVINLLILIRSITTNNYNYCIGDMS